MRLESEIHWFEAIPLLSLMEREALRLVAFAAERKEYRAGDILVRRGQPSDGGLLITDGQVALDPGDAGRPAVRILGPGALIGEMALFTETENTANAIAREPVAVLRVGRGVMQRVLREFPESASRIRDGIALRLGAFREETAPIRDRLLAIDAWDRPAS